MADQAGAAEVAFFPTFEGFRSKTTREVESTGKESGGRFSKAFSGAIAGVAASIAALGIGSAIKSQFAEGIAGASALQQSTGAIEAVFKGYADQMKGFASTAKTSLGITANEYQELGTVIGSQLKNGGTAMEELAPKTAALISTGADLSAMFGGSTKEAVEALSSALKGERDPIERYGVSLTQAKIDAEAAALGFEKVGGTYDSTAQQAATLALITTQTADAQGAAAREAGSFASQQARLSATFKEGRTAIVGAFLPAVTAVTAFLADKLPAAIVVAEAAAQGLVAGLGELWTGLSGAGTLDVGGLTGFGARVREVAGQIIEAVRPIASTIGTAFATGDFSTFASLFDSVLAVARPAAPIMAELGASVGQLSQPIADLVGSALPLLPGLLGGATDAMTYLSQNTGALKVALAGIVGAFLLVKAATVASTVAAALSLPMKALEVTSQVAHTVALRANTAAIGTNTAAERVSLGARLASAGASLRAGIAAGVSKVAMIAGAVATGVATAAQWAFNAALTANPIGVIIALIVALVAGLVWFFTQTDLGRQVWSSFMTFLAEAWANIVAVAQVVWQTIVTAVQIAWSLIVLYVQTYIAVVSAIVGAVLGFIVGVWNAGWDLISSVVSAVWSFIVAYVTTYINTVLAIVTAVVGFVLAVWSAGWNAVSAVVQAVWAFVVSVITSAVDTVSSIVSTLVRIFTDAWNGAADAVSAGVDTVIQFFIDLPGTVVDVLGDMGQLLFESGQSLIQGFIDGISGMIGAVGDAVGGVLDFAGGFFPNSPAKRGPLSGDGWRRIGRSGKAVVRAFNDGMGSEPITGLEQLGGVTGSRSLARNASDIAVAMRTTSDAAADRPLTLPDILVNIDNRSGLGEFVRAEARFATAADARRAAHLGARR